MQVIIKTRDRNEYEMLRTQLEDENIEYTSMKETTKYFGHDWIPDMNETMYQIKFFYSDKLI